MKVNIHFDSIEISSLEAKGSQTFGASLQAALANDIKTYLAEYNLPNNKEIQVRQGNIKINSAGDIQQVSQGILKNIDRIIRQEMDT